MPMIMPPIMLMNTTSRPAMASPRTNFEAPSMAPKKPLSSSSALRRGFAGASSVRPGGGAAAVALFFPGVGAHREGGADSAVGAAPLGVGTEFTTNRGPDNENS